MNKIFFNTKKKIKNKTAPNDHHKTLEDLVHDEQNPLGNVEDISLDKKDISRDRSIGKG